jgi:hypothetical protein
VPPEIIGGLKIHKIVPLNKLARLKLTLKELSEMTAHSVVIVLEALFYKYSCQNLFGTKTIFRLPITTPVLKSY